ncbi:MAG: hypothetical protein NTY45_00860 [Elusimicrobia bacterium]|nr:hypothetical protein [Elusimicrobiota bacterium]
MEFPDISAAPAESVILWAAPAFFCVFLLVVLAARLASGKNCTARLHRTNLLFFIPYALASLLFPAATGRLSRSLLPAFAAGCFIYFSLHHIYLMAFIGLAKKSFSVNILSDIRTLGGGRGAAALTALLAHESAKTAFVRQDRLNQMTVLGMAELRGSEYRITPRGRFLNGLGNAMLKLWNLRRL